MRSALGTIQKLYRDPFFETSLNELRSKGGNAAAVAEKAEEFIHMLTGAKLAGNRGIFRFTRNGEYRIKNCYKVDLGSGYRIVCILKDRRIVLLYVGTHDDCFRWIERRRTAEYALSEISEQEWIDCKGRMPADFPCNEPETTDWYAEEYEKSLMARIDDAVLRRIFRGLADRR